MKLRISTAWLFLIPLLLSVSWLGSVVHESDQASVMLGALRLAHGDAPWVGQGFYEYGNYFLSYWLLAGLFALFPRLDPVFLANAVGLGVFWLGAGVLLFSVRKKLSSGRSIAAFSALAAPAVLVHLPCFAPNFVSAGFLFAGAGLLNVSRRLFPVSVLLWMLAFGCRMDGLLLVPLLAWLSTETPSFKKLVSGRRSWILAGCAVLMFSAGKFLNGFAPSLSYVPFFIPKVYAAFLVFGAGGAFVLLVMLVQRLLRKGMDQYETDARLFWWGAVPALLAPFVFYSVFMFSTRHWVVLIVGLLMVVCSSHTERWWIGEKVRNAVLLFCALIPLLIGIHLPFVTQPSLTMRVPTLFPTTDGRCPMGAVVPFMFSEQRIDHNQKTWLAARAVKHWDENNARIPLSSFQLFDIVRLAAFLNGQGTNERGADLSDGSFFYSSSRALLKPEVHLDTKKIIASQDGLDDVSLEEVGGQFPVSILRISSVKTGTVSPGSDLKKRIIFLRQMFQGDEIDWLGELSAGVLSLPGKYEGHPILFFSEKPFDLTVSSMVLHAEYMPQPGDKNGFFCVRIPFPHHKNGPISVSHSVWGCATIYPGYMSLKNM